jgi:hypothetical protein
MKKVLSIAGMIGFMLIIGFAVISCEKKGSPSSVIKQFYAAIEKGNTEEIKRLMAPGEGEVMLMFAEKAKGMVTARGGIKNIEETIDGDKAVVNTTFKDDTVEDLNLINVDGEWRITLEK